MLKDYSIGLGNYITNVFSNLNIKVIESKKDTAFEEYAKYKINCAKEVLKDNYIVIYGTHIHLFDIEKYPLCEEGLKILEINKNK